jgi:hypothetical protein
VTPAGRAARLYNPGMSEPLASFRGAVSAARAAYAPLGLTLTGTSTASATQGGEPTQLAFSGAAPALLPAVLQDLTVSQPEGGHYRLSAAGIGGQREEWLLEARAAHLHHDVGAAFYRALPPRAVPWSRRLLWALLLRLAASRAGLSLLAALRR